MTIDAVLQRHLTESLYDIAGRLIESRSNLSVRNYGPNLHPALGTATIESTQVQRTFYEYDEVGRQTVTELATPCHRDGLRHVILS